MWSSTSAANIKKTERWLINKKLNFNLFELSSLKDEHNRPIRKLVANKILDDAVKKKYLILFVGIFKINNSNYIFANDRRKGRRWMLIKENLTEDQVLYYFEELLKFEKRDILILPHGSMVKFCRNIIKITIKMSHF